MRLPAIRRRSPAAGLPDRAGRAPVHARLRRFSGFAGIATLALSFVGGAFALVADMLPAERLLGHTGVDLGVALLFVPLCALVFVLVAEAVRAVFSDRALRSSRGKPLNLGAWQPGRGEG